MNQLGQVSEHGNRKYEIPVLVYPADQKFMLAARHEECVELASLVSRLQTENATLRSNFRDMEEGRDDCDKALKVMDAENATLRELVLEAATERVLPASWYWRAEKAVERK